ncbi:MAG: short-subunit dehydrogenase, partial [Flavobacteriales bacterium]
MKRIIITGASSGIGAATAKQLAEKGHHLVIAARRTAQLDKLVNQFPDQVKAIS